MNFEASERPGTEWDLFVAKHTDVLFYSSVWGEVLKDGLGGQLCYMSLRDDNLILCGMPAVVLTYGGIKLLYSALPYGGYIGDMSLFNSFMERALEETRATDIVYVTPFCQEVKTGYTKYFEATEEAATRIDLRGRVAEEVQSCYKASARYSIKKGARIGLEVLRCEDRESFLTAYRLYLQSMRRNHAIVRYSIDWFMALHQVLSGEGLAIVYMAKYNGIPISAMVVINSLNGFHFLHIGSSTEHLRLRANDLVVSEVIRDAIREEKEYVDFMFSDPQDISLIKWKEKFGGLTILLNKYHRVNSPLKYALWNSAKGVTSFLQRFR